MNLFSNLLTWSAGLLVVVTEKAQQAKNAVHSSLLRKADQHENFQKRTSEEEVGEGEEEETGEEEAQEEEEKNVEEEEESASSLSVPRALPAALLPLHPCDFTDLVEDKQREWFDGSREWLLEEVRHWLQDDDKKRLCWLVGGAGTGKSVVSAQLLVTKGVGEHVKAWHFCRHNDAAGSDTKRILQSWAAMLANNLKGFELPIIEGKDKDGENANNNDAEKKDLLSAREMFKLLIADPLASMKTPTPPSPCVIVLDALDELPRERINDVLQLLTEEFDQLPSFVRLFVASRDEALLSTRLARFKQVKLEADEVRNRADLRMYLAEVARRHVTLELSMADLETQLEREFNLAPFRLRNKLHGLDNSMRRCKDIYAAAVAKLLESSEAEARSFGDICKIKPTDGPRRQCSGDLDQLYRDAEEAYEKLSELLANEQIEVRDPGLKSRDSAVRKQRAECDGDASRLKDLVRFTALFSTCVQMKLFVERLCGERKEEAKSRWPGVTVLGLKNKYSRPSALGHRDLNLTLGVELASGRVHLCELQVNLKDMMTAARLTHFFYKEVRVQVPEVCKREGIADMEGFKAKLSKMLRSSVLEAAVNELERKAQGLFLYASLLARHLEVMRHKVKFAELKGLPNGLSQIYETNFGRMVKSKDQWQEYSRLISLVVAAREPLPVTVAREIVGAGCEQMEQALSLLFPVRGGRFQVMHKSVADWLQDLERESLFTISKEDIQAAHRSMGHHCRNQLAQHANDFCVRHVVYHLCMAELWDEVYAVATALDNWLLPRAQMDPLGAVLDLELAAKQWSNIRLMGQALRIDLAEVRRDYRSLPGRLVGRLIGYEAKQVQELLNEVRKWRGPPEGWWCPVQPTLEPAGGALMMMLQWRNQAVQWNPGNPNQLGIFVLDCLHILEVSSGQTIQTLDAQSVQATAMAWSSGGRICSGSQDNTVRVWDVASGQCIHILKGPTRAVTSVSWSSDGKISCGSCDGIVRVWDLSEKNEECVRTLEGHSQIVTSVSWSGDARRVCSGGQDKTVRVWNVSSGECVQTLQGHSEEVTSVSWDRGNRICSGSYDKTVRVWDVLSGKCMILNGHSDQVTSVSWSSDDSRICSGSHDCTVRVWDASSGKLIQTLEGHSARVTSVSWSSNDRICSRGEYSAVRVWDLSCDQLTPRTLKGHSNEVTSVSWSRDSRICSGSQDATVRVWDVSSGECIRTLTGHSNEVTFVLWSNDDRKICSGSEDATVRVWDVSSGECIQVLQGHFCEVTSLSWSSDDKKICSGSQDSTVRIWNVLDGKCLQTLEGHSHIVTSVSWSSDNSRICSGSWDHTVRVWEVSSGRCVQILEGHSSFVTSVAWGSFNRICSGSEDNTVRVWANVSNNSWECIRTLAGHSSRVTSVSWGGGDNTVCSESHDGSVKVWDVKSGDCLQTLRRHCLPSACSFSGPLPVGFTMGNRLSVCPADPHLAVAIGRATLHCLHRLGGSRALSANAEYPFDEEEFEMGEQKRSLR